MKPRKLWERLVANPRNADFHDLVKVVQAFGFILERVTGSHHIYRHPAIGEKLNLQPEGSRAKAYQVRQFIALVDAYNLQIEDSQS